MKLDGKISPDERKCITDWILLLAGAATGLTLAWIFAGFEWSFPGELERARESGIISLTTMLNYPKSRDIINYFLSICLPVIGALIFWMVGRRSSDMGKNVLAGKFPALTKSLWLVVALSLFTSAYISWHVVATLDVGWNKNLGLWVFLGEEGATLAWIQSILTGGIFGKDFYSLYGSMFVYPLAWMMKLTGYSAVMERIYKLLLDLIATGILGYILARTLRSKWLAAGFILMICLLNPAQSFPSANTTTLRMAFPLLPITIVALWMESRKGLLLIFGGILMGQSLLFSHEAGFCAIIAITAMFIFSLESKQDFFIKIGAWGIFFVMLAISVFPMIGYLVLNGGGFGLIDSIFGYPKMVQMGFGCLPFPSIRDLLSVKFFAFALPYEIIAVYVVTAIALGIAWLRGQRSSRFVWALGLLIYGILSFRSALGRSADMQTARVMFPAIILMALWIDELWASWRHLGRSIVRSAWTLILLFALLINIAGICLNQNSRCSIDVALQYAFTMDGKFSAANIIGVPMPDLPRLGFVVDDGTANSLREIGRFLDKNTKPLDYVYFFPNEAVYYFLFNRTNPTRYPVSYIAATFERQREVVRDLEKNKPRYVIYSRNTWRIDYIPEAVQIPIIVQYLKARYKIVQKMDSFDVLERVIDR